MKIAISMRYGGEVISAEECDYDSYLTLSIVCPECHESLFLRAGSSRVSPKGKEYKIPAHWCHRQASAEQVELCELRVSKYTKEDLERRAKQARGQRLKLIEKHLLISFAVDRVRNDKWRIDPNAVKSARRFMALASQRNEYDKYKSSELFLSFIQTCQSMTQEDVSEWMPNLGKGKLASLMENKWSFAWAGAFVYTEATKGNMQTQDDLLHFFRMQSKTTFEIIKFLGAKQNRNIALKLFASSVFSALANVKSRDGMTSMDGKAIQFGEFAVSCIQSSDLGFISWVLFSLFTTSWADCFDYMEKHYAQTAQTKKGFA